MGIYRFGGILINMDRIRYDKEEARLRLVLKYRRQELGIRQAELAHLMGKARTFVSKYEQGERFLTFTEALELCKWLCIDEMTLIKKMRNELPLEDDVVTEEEDEVLLAAEAAGEPCSDGCSDEELEAPGDVEE